MLLLAVDTSAKSGSVALVRWDQERFIVLELASIAGGTFSAQLVPTIQAVLARQGVSKTDVDLLGVASGPGSFTGLRIGLAAIKGLAEVLHKPVVAVSMLDAFIAMSRLKGRVAVMLDAWRDEFFLGTYESSHNVAQTSGQMQVTRDEARQRLQQHSPELVLTSDSSVHDLLQRWEMPVELVNRPDSTHVARVAIAEFLAGRQVPADRLDANYGQTDARTIKLPRQAEK